MKARHISISFASVYALGLLDQVRVIRRGPDGFWGPWQATGVNAKRLVHAGTVMALIGLDDRVAIYEQLPGRVQHSWDFQASELSVVALPRGGGALFALSAGRVWHASKPSVLAPWSTGSRWAAPPTGWPRCRPRGGTTVCCIHAGAISYASQGAPTSEWSSWETWGARAAAPRIWRSRC